MFEKIIAWFKRVFNITPKKTVNEQQKEKEFVSRYEDTTELNITVMAANKLSNLVCSEAVISVTGGTKTTANEYGDEITVNVSNPRSIYLNTSLQRVINNLKYITVRVFGYGGVILKPYTYRNQIYTEILPQSRFFVVEQHGEVITKAGFIAEEITGDRSDIKYTRMEYHSLEQDGTYIIENRVISAQNGEIPLTSIPEWAGIEPKITMHGIDMMLFSFIKSPTDDRKATSSIYGVPITYGQDKLIKMILDIFNEIPDEYKNKKTFIGADDSLFREENGKKKLPASGLYKLFRGTGSIDSKPLFEMFSPDIRETSYFAGLDYLFGLLEKAIAVNSGVLTDMESRDATATAIKRSTVDTYATVDSMHKNIEAAIDQLVYAFDKIADHYNLVSKGEYAINYDWSYLLLEDSEETFNQIQQTVAAGGLPIEYQTAYVTDLSIEEARKLVPKQIPKGQIVGE